MYDIDVLKVSHVDARSPNTAK